MGLGACASATAAVAQWLSGHARLTIDIELPDKTRKKFSLYGSARSSDSGCIFRALAHPALWADAASVALQSLTVAGRPLTSDRLPAALPVGYNHIPAPEGAVYAAANAGDMPALQAALDDGGSTEEADIVRWKKGMEAGSVVAELLMYRGGGKLLFTQWHHLSLLKDHWTAFCCATAHGHFDVLRMLVAEQAPTPPLQTM